MTPSVSLAPMKRIRRTDSVFRSSWTCLQRCWERLETRRTQSDVFLCIRPIEAMVSPAPGLESPMKSDAALRSGMPRCLGSVLVIVICVGAAALPLRLGVDSVLVVGHAHAEAADPIRGSALAVGAEHRFQPFVASV